MANIITVTLKSWYYMAENVFYYLFYKKRVDKKIKQYLNRKYKKDDVVVVAIHGVFEYYWQSYPKYMKYFEKKGKCIIPIQYNFFDHQKKSMENIKKQIEDIHKKTKAKIVILGDSDGGFVGAMYMLEKKPNFVKEFIPLTMYYQMPRGVAFWWVFIKVTPDKFMNYYFNRFKKEKIPTMKINLCAKYDAFILPARVGVSHTAKNFTFDTGHFGMLYDMEVIRFVYKHIFG